MEIIIVLLLIAGIVAGCYVLPNHDQAPIPTPTNARSDLKFAYYGSYPGIDGAPSQLDETRENVNLFMASRWWGPDSQLAQGMDAARAGLLLLWDLPEALQPGYGANDPASYDLAAAEVRVRARLQQLLLAGILRQVTAFFIVDEPELAGWTSQQLRDTAAMVRRAQADVLSAAPLAVVYSTIADWPAIEEFELVGINRYDESVFNSGDFTRLKAALRPDQKIMLYPGGAANWKQDPAPFFNVAQTDPQVWGIVAFVWRDDYSITGWGQGIRSNGMAPAYNAIGQKIKNGTL